MHGFTDFYNPVCPAHFVGSRVPLRPCRLSPSERRVHFPTYRACDRTRGPHMVSGRCINRWSPVSPTHVSPSHAMPNPRHFSPPLSLLIVLGQPPPMLVPLFLVLFLLLVFIVVNLATLSGNAMIITDPGLPILYRYIHLQLLLLIHCLLLTGHPFLAVPPCPRSLSIRGTPHCSAG